MEVIDIIILCAFLPSLYFGIKSGLVRQIVSLCVIILGISLSMKFTNIAAEWLLQFIDINPKWMTIISFTLIFITVALLLNLIGKIIEKVIQISMLGWLNRLLGLILSLFKVSLIVALCVVLLDNVNSMMSIIPNNEIDNSVLYEPMVKYANTIFPYLKSLFYNFK